MEAKQTAGSSSGVSPFNQDRLFCSRNRWNLGVGGNQLLWPMAIHLDIHLDLQWNIFAMIDSLRPRQNAFNRTKHDRWYDQMWNSQRSFNKGCGPFRADTLNPLILRCICFSHTQSWYDLQFWGQCSCLRFAALKQSHPQPRNCWETRNNISVSVSVVKISRSGLI